MTVRRLGVTQFVMNARMQISNDTARRLFLDRHMLLRPPEGPARGDDLLQVIEAIGFVQVDSINTVARAHHMILSARKQQYRQANLTPLLERERAVFEHWTHDASVIPTAFFPHWRYRFDKDEKRLKHRWRTWFREGFESKVDEVLDQIANHGPCGSADVGQDEKRSTGGWWDWHPSKTALEFLWRTGRISVTRRQGFQKVYDLTENVIPADTFALQPERDETIDWACWSALERLGFATSGEVSAFWDLVSPDQAKTWCARHLADGILVEVDIDCADGKAPRRSFAFPATLETLDALPQPSQRVRILSPFDPALRDRKRAERLFRFDYRIEIFVPEAKRTYGYYVFPVMEGTQMIGRIDMKSQRDTGLMHIRAFWPQPGIRMGSRRITRLMAELDRTARAAGSEAVSFEKDWLREALDL